MTDGQAERLAALDRDLVKLVFLTVAERIAELVGRVNVLEGKVEAARKPDPHTPSGQRPIYTKPPSKKRKGRPGAKKGHPGSRRPKPQRIDEHKQHMPTACPHCGCDELGPPRRQRTRTIEDLRRDLRAMVTEHTIHGCWCPKCKKYVEAVVPDAMPNAAIGHRTVTLTSWLHYGVAVPISALQQLLGCQFQTRLSAGGLVASWQRLAEMMHPWYVQIGEQALRSAVLHADETGWRMNGKTWWLWCFANRACCYYLLDPSRGSVVVERFFADAFDGTLVTDFWAAYNRVNADEYQKCIPHLLRELDKVDLRNTSAEWQAFAKKLRRLLRDGIRLRKRPDFEPQTYASRIVRIDRRLMALATATYQDADAKRLGKRLLRYCDELFTFLDRPEVPYDNNLAERMIRPAVILRKVSQQNRSEKGAAVQAVLMSIYRTLKLRGHNPVDTIEDAVRTCLQTGELPPLPSPLIPDG